MYSTESIFQIVTGDSLETNRNIDRWETTEEVEQRIEMEGSLENLMLSFHLLDRFEWSSETDDTATKLSIFQKIWEFVKKIWSTIKEMITKFVQKIYNFLTSTDRKAKIKIAIEGVKRSRDKSKAEEWDNPIDLYVNHEFPVKTVSVTKQGEESSIKYTQLREYIKQLNEYHDFIKNKYEALSERGEFTEKTDFKYRLGALDVKSDKMSAAKFSVVVLGEDLGDFLEKLDNGKTDVEAVKKLMEKINKLATEILKIELIDKNRQFNQMSTIGRLMAGATGNGPMDVLKEVTKRGESLTKLTNGVTKVVGVIETTAIGVGRQLYEMTSE